jgi:hypothetical protein
MQYFFSLLLLIASTCFQHLFADIILTKNIPIVVHTVTPDDGQVSAQNVQRLLIVIK